MQFVHWSSISERHTWGPTKLLWTRSRWRRICSKPWRSYMKNASVMLKRMCSQKLLLLFPVDAIFGSQEPPKFFVYLWLLIFNKASFIPQKNIWVLYSQLNPHNARALQREYFFGKVSLWYKRFVYFFTEGVSLCQKIYLCVTSYSCLSTSFRWYVGQPATGSTCHTHKLECTTSW